MSEKKKDYKAVLDDYDIKKVYEEIEELLIESMSRNLGRHLKEEEAKGFKWPQWQALKLKDIKQFQAENKAIFEQYDSEIDEIVEQKLKKQFEEGALQVNKEALDAGKIKKEDAGLGGTFFRSDKNKLNSLIKAVQSDMKDVKYSILRKSNDVYRSTVFKSALIANTGSITTKKAIDKALESFLERGYETIIYKDGSKHHIKDYTDMAIKTASTRARLTGAGTMRKKLKNPLVYITKHSTSCARCSPWQGKVYIDDVWSGGKKDDGDYPLLSAAIQGGLYHPRCEHHHVTYYEGINKSPEEIAKEEETPEHEPKDPKITKLEKQLGSAKRLAIRELRR